MIAMQYSFVLPADYDMAIVRQRVASKAPLLDDLPGLCFKAYLIADGGDAADQLYAPFYLWREAQAMHDFLNGPGFASVTRAFGWPAVPTWTPWHVSVGAEVRQARHATRTVEAIAAHSALAALRQRQEQYAESALARGALAVVVGIETATWTLVRLCLWRDEPAVTAGEQRYRVAHLSAPGH